MTIRRRSCSNRSRHAGKNGGRRRSRSRTQKRRRSSRSVLSSIIKAASRPLSSGTCWQVFCDLDGVLADFDRGVVERTGSKPNQFSRRHRMWRSLAPPETKDFFSTLPPMRDASQLWTFLRPLSPAILTGAPSGDWAAPQKRKWCAEQLSLPAERVLVVDATDKALFSHPGAVLIDDYEKHRAPWEARGGIFIHFRSAMESIALLEGALRHLGDRGALPPVWPVKQSTQTRIPRSPRSWQRSTNPLHEVQQESRGPSSEIARLRRMYENGVGCKEVPLTSRGFVACEGPVACVAA